MNEGRGKIYLKPKTQGNLIMKGYLSFALVLLVSLIMLTCQDSANLVTTPEGISNEGTSFSKATVVNLKFTDPGSWTAWGECLGEWLYIEYSDYYNIHTTLDGNGGFHSVMHIRPVAPYLATGLTTGRTWIPVGSVTIMEQSGGVDSIYTWAGCWVWRCQQPGEPNLQEPWTIDITVNANGEVTANKETIRFICNGN